MQTAVKFFDFSTQGSFGNIDKVAIKVSGKNEALNCRTASDFLKIMGAAMRLDPEQVQASLDQFDTIPLEGEAGNGFAPLIDLSGEEDDPVDLVALLMGKGVAEEEVEAREDNECHGCVDTAGMTPETVNENTGQAVYGLDTLIRGEGAPVAEGKADKAPVEYATKNSAPNPYPQKTPVPPLASALPEKDTDAKAMHLDGKPPVHAQTLVSRETTPPNGDVQPPVDANAGKTLAEKPAAPRAAAAAEKLAAGDGRTETMIQASVAGEAAQATRPDRTSSTPSKKPTVTTAPGTSAGPQAGVQEIKPAMGEALRMNADTAKSPDHTLVADTDERPATANTGEGDAVLRAPAGREGFQSTLSRFDPNVSKGADTAAADKAMPEPTSKEMQNDVMRQIVQRMTLRTQGGQSKMQIHLKPEFLGNVHMQITTENQQVAVRMTAESVVVKEMIEQHLSFLKSELQQHGLEIDKFDVQVGGDREGWKNSQDPSGFRQALKDGQQGRMGRGPKEQQDDKDGSSKKAPPEERRQTSEIDYFA